MKQFVSVLFLSVLFFQSNAQVNGPSNITFDSSMIKNEEYTLTWYMLQDTLKHEMGKVTTRILKDEDEILFITNVKMQRATSPWIDSTIVKTKDFAPIYHASQNQNRDMAMHYNKGVKGFYLDKKTKQKIELDESPTGSYFDSSSYPYLIRWLPLEEGYRQTIQIFDFNPNAKTGLLKVDIKEVSEVELSLKKGNTRAWKVYVTDEISNNQVNNYYYIDQHTRELIKHEIEVSGRKMVMEKSDF